MDEQSIFQQALDQPAGQPRAAWLDEVCGNRHSTNCWNNTPKPRALSAISPPNLRTRNTRSLDAIAHGSLDTTHDLELSEHYVP